jgi:hypothetical protein
MENNITDMRKRHREEIVHLQLSCSHRVTKTMVSSFEARIFCQNCGKIINRVRK